MSDIFLIPQKIFCNNCNKYLTLLNFIFNPEFITCRNCGNLIFVKDIAKQFGVIKNVAD